MLCAKLDSDQQGIPSWFSVSNLAVSLLSCNRLGINAQQTTVESFMDPCSSCASYGDDHDVKAACLRGESDIQQLNPVFSTTRGCEIPYVHVGRRVETRTV